MTHNIIHQYKSEDFDLFIELIDIGVDPGFPFVHCTVRHWSPSVMRQIQAVWPAFRAQFKGPVFAWNQNEDEKWEKFVQRFGFRFYNNFLGPDDKEHKLFLHI